jgi:HPt (histidine-containing phosphotransfer) domain-containing protein
MIHTAADLGFTKAISTEDLYDLCMIERLCRGNQEQVKKMVSVFVKQVPQTIEEIKSAYTKRDFVTIKNAAHRIKPILSYYAIVKIEKDIREVEAMAKDELATFEMELKIKKLDEVLSQVVAAMKKDILNY